MSYFCSSQMDMDTLHISLRLLISLKEYPRHKILCQNVIHVLKVLGKKEHVNLGGKSGGRKRERIGGQRMRMNLVQT